VVLLNKGEKRAEGSPKDMVNLYKKILVGVDGKKEFQKSAQTAGETVRWKDSFQLNPDVNEYGNGKAEIIDFAIEDENGVLTNTIVKGSTFTIRSKVRFYEPVNDPIFTYTFKTLKGTDITGTNTMFEKTSVGQTEAGDVYVASFTQEMNLQGGEYLLSISCTGFDGMNFQAYHRLYDVINITVVSDKNTVGFYDMNSQVSIEKVN
jgi:teichoic acid transport system ATP-binding protein